MRIYYRSENDKIVDVIYFNDLIEIIGEDGEVTYLDDVNKWVKDNYLLSDRNIVQLVDGSYAFEDEVDFEAERLNKIAKELADLKEARVADMKAERDRIQEEPITYNEKSFDYNKESLQKLNEAKDALQGTTDKQIWICADNSLTYLTYEDIMAIKKLGKDRSNDVHIQYAKLKYLIESKETAEEVMAINFETDTSFIPLEV